MGVCVGLGDKTVFGRIANEATRERTRRTTLETEILRFVIVIALLAISVAILIVSTCTSFDCFPQTDQFPVLWAAWLRVEHPDFINVPTLLVDCVSVAVAFIPGKYKLCIKSLMLTTHVIHRGSSHLRHTVLDRNVGIVCNLLSNADLV